MSARVNCETMEKKSGTLQNSMNWKRRKILVTASSGALVLAVLSVWQMGSWLCAPRPAKVGDLPRELHGENVAFPSASSAKLRGWFLPGRKGRGAVVLLHPIRANRTAMLGRARFLNRAGYAVLLFDFRAHGESSGQQTSFGARESEDVQSGVAWVRAKVPGEKIALLGWSLGGAAALLCEPPVRVEGMILEMVYPTIEDATANRLEAKFGQASRVFSPLLTAQLPLRLGVSARDLRPVDKVARVAVPKLFLGGTRDPFTPPSETQSLFDAAATPKKLWMVEGAEHVDLHGFSKTAYETRVLGFLGEVLR